MTSKITLADMDAAIIGYLSSLGNEQKATILNIIKSFIHPSATDNKHWDDPAFVAEMDRRYDEYKSGSVKCSSWEEVKARAEKTTKERRKNGAA